MDILELSKHYARLRESAIRRLLRTNPCMTRENVATCVDSVMGELVNTRPEMTLDDVISQAQELI